jgi:hypothetical protein
MFFWIFKFSFQFVFVKIKVVLFPWSVDNLPVLFFI